MAGFRRSWVVHPWRVALNDTPELRNTVAFSTTGIHLFPNAELAVKIMRDGAEAGVFIRVEKSVSAVGPVPESFSVNVFFRAVGDEGGRLSWGVCRSGRVITQRQPLLR
jgi:hypothetical protein